MTKNVERGYPGQYFEDFLKEQGDFENTTERAVKRVLAYQLSEEMKKQGISKVEMARRLCTSRSQLSRVLNPESDRVSIGVLVRAANVVGRKLRLDLT